MTETNINFHEWIQDRIGLPNRVLTIQDDGYKSIIFSIECKRGKRPDGHRMEHYDSVGSRGSDASEFLRYIADGIIEKWGIE